MGVEAASSGHKPWPWSSAEGGVARSRSERGIYAGVPTCQAATLVGGGGKMCQYGCLGHGDCVSVCPFDAIHLNENRLPVVDREKCTACGKCVEACPKKLIELHSLTHRIFVLCKSQDKGPQVKKACSVGCIGCRICVKTCSVEGGMTVNGTLAVVNYDICPAEEALVEKCPMKTIRIVIV
jgi:Na+-translocating ferredoxin:NAD+ oxidoreductase subunit B